MKCDEARRLLPGLALGELDAEPARALGDHLRACAECRNAETSLAAAARALRSAPAAPSSERREAAAAAMGREHADLAERLLARPRRRWLRWASAAAALLVLAGAAAFLRPAVKLELRVVRVTGEARVHRPITGVCVPLSSGDVVRAGERVVTEDRSVVRFESASGALDADQETSFTLASGGRIVLDRGTLCTEPREGAPLALVIADTAGNLVEPRKGLVETALRRRLIARVASGDAILGGSHGQRLRATAGQKGHFDIAGTPFTTETAMGSVAEWREAGYYAQPARSMITLPRSLSSGMASVETRGGRRVEFEIVEAKVNLPALEIEELAAAGGEVVMPFRVKFGPKK